MSFSSCTIGGAAACAVVEFDIPDNCNSSNEERALSVVRRSVRRVMGELLLLLLALPLVVWDGDVVVMVIGLFVSSGCHCIRRDDNMHCRDCGKNLHIEE